MMTLRIRDIAGPFAENKDAAATARETVILPTLQGGKDVLLDFEGVDDATQSFVHALISEPFRKYGPSVLERMTFKHCNERIQGVITLVSVYMQESL